MRCPYCNQEFPLTWARYWRSPTGRHICPRCQKPSRFRTTTFTLLRQVPAIFLGAIPIGFLFYRWFGGDLWFVGFVLGGSLTALPIDKFIDGRYRPLEKVDTHDDTSAPAKAD